MKGDIKIIDVVADIKNVERCVYLVCEQDVANEISDKCLAIAISHDRLVAENEKLREALKELSKVVKLQHTEVGRASKIEVLRAMLTDFIEYGEGKKIRRKIHGNAKLNYKPVHSDLYLEFMNNNECNFEINHAQSTNSPYYFTLFTVKSQHVMGDCAEECLDKAISSSL